jgi:uncharacterized protein YbaR (Trm112 family)
MGCAAPTRSSESPIAGAGRSRLINGPIRSKIPEMIDKGLLEILVCPVCKKPLTEKNDALKCSQCRRLYPVRDNIPIMLIDEATFDTE